MWTSGFPTVATSGVAFLTDPRWGAWRGALAVALLKDQGISLMRMNPTPGAEPGRGGHPARPGRGLRADSHPDAGPGRCPVASRRRTAPTTASCGSRPRRPPRRWPSAASCRPRASPWRAPAPQVSVFVRSTGDRVSRAAQHRRRRHLGRVGSVPASRSTNAPSAASSAAGRVEPASPAVPRGRWCTRGSRRVRRVGSTDLGGRVIAQHAASLGDGTLDVFAVAPSGPGYAPALRRRGAGAAGWPSAALHLGAVRVGRPGARQTRHVSGRGRDGATSERAVHPDAAPVGHLGRGARTASPPGPTAPSGDAWPGRRAARRRRRVRRAGGRAARAFAGRHHDGLVDLRGRHRLPRPDGSFLMAGRGSDGAAVGHPTVGPSSYASRSLGGVVR